MAGPVGNDHPSGWARDWVAVLLAVGLATALNIIVVAVLWDAIASQGPGLSENATQIITGAFGGIIGVLGSYLGYRAGAARHSGSDSGSASGSGSGSASGSGSPDGSGSPPSAGSMRFGSGRSGDTSNGSAVSGSSDSGAGSSMDTPAP